MGLTSRGNSAKVFLRHPFRIKGKNRLYPIEKKGCITLFATHYKDLCKLKEKYNQIMKHVGYSTNFEAAFDAYLKICVSNGVTDDELQSILCITDGQMNDFDRSSVWETCYDNITKKWIIAGYKKPPTMIFWNVRANTRGYQAEANKEGIQLLSGFSPSVIKGVLYVARVLYIGVYY